MYLFPNEANACILIYSILSSHCLGIICETNYIYIYIYIYEFMCVMCTSE